MARAENIVYGSRPTISQNGLVLSLFRHVVFFPTGWQAAQHSLSGGRHSLIMALAVRKTFLIILSAAPLVHALLAMLKASFTPSVSAAFRTIRLQK